MTFIRSILAKLTRPPKDGAVELIRIHPVLPVTGPDAWSRPMIVPGATSKRATNPIDIDLMLKRLARRMVEMDWETALDEEAIREAMKDAMPADAPSRARRRL